MQCFPVRPVPEGMGHPILEDIVEFEVCDEVWGQNLGTGVRRLLSVDVGDRISSHPRFRQPIPVCACKGLGQGRLAFFSLGHFHAMYEHPQFLRLATNALLWACKQIHESQYAYDLFLSFSSHNKDEARQIYDHASALGLRVFMDERGLHPGDEWIDLVRRALVESRELALLASPDSLKSEWVTTEWGAAWVLQRRIVPILFRCDVNTLPERLRRYQLIDFHAHEKYLGELRDRGGP